jgi:hypothetical protein
VCCFHVDNAELPTYKILKSSFFSYGGFSACHSQNCCSGVSEYQEFIQLMIRKLIIIYLLLFFYFVILLLYYLFIYYLGEVETENYEATKSFFEKEYGCSSFQELVQSNIISNGYQNHHQQGHQQGHQQTNATYSQEHIYTSVTQEPSNLKQDGFHTVMGMISVYIYIIFILYI